MVTPDGYVFRLKYIDGGLHLPMAYPTYSELDSLLHVEFSSPGLRDPNSEVDDHNHEAWFNAIDDPDDPDALDDNDFFMSIIISFLMMMLSMLQMDLLLLPMSTLILLNVTNSIIGIMTT
jgi:hypothetical protein